MKKAQTANLKALISKALQSMKIYTDFGGEACGIDVLASLFKWPDVTLGIIDIIDGVEGAEEQAIQDIGQIMLRPLMALSAALLAAIDPKVPASVHSNYEQMISAPVDFKDISSIVNKRDVLVSAITELTVLMEKKNENRDSGSGKQEGGI